MKIDLTKIPLNGLDVDNNVTLKKEIYINSEVLDVKDLHILGNINYDYDNSLIIKLKVKGILVLNDAITLEPIDYSFTCDIDEKIMDIVNYCGEFYEKSKNILDISEILWENIVLEIPISITNVDSKNLRMQGEGWELKNNKSNEIDPRLAKLTELYGEGKE